MHDNTQWSLFIVNHKELKTVTSAITDSSKLLGFFPIKLETCSSFLYLKNLIDQQNYSKIWEWLLKRLVLFLLIKDLPKIGTSVIDKVMVNLHIHQVM